ncbi:MAG TPA: twin-arginine translocase TatA/TatE family subunit [Candidatus Didemnitutus sp.]|jgi:sec-independent protein translocase protein TatA
MLLPSLPLAVFGIGGSELLIILLIVLLLFGGAKLPALARGMGESIREFKKAAREEPDAKAGAEKKSDEGHGKN